MWVGFVPLIFFLLQEKYTLKEKIVGACVTGSIYFIIVLWPLASIEPWWISSSIGQLYAYQSLWNVGIIALSLYGALITYGLFAYLFLNLRTNTWKDFLLMPALWVAVEGIRTFSAFGMGWGHIGYNAHDTPQMAQIASTVGIYGVAFMLFAVNGVVAYTLFEYTQKRRMALGTALSLLVIFLILITTYTQGNMRIQVFESTLRDITEDKKIALIQVNKNTRELSTPEIYMDIFDSMRTATKHSDIMVLPENIFPLFTLNVDTQKLVGVGGGHTIDTLFDSFTSISYEHPDITFILGMHTMRQEKMFNSFIVLEEGTLKDVYEKRAILPLFEGASSFFPNNTTAIYSGDKTKNAVKIRGNQITPLICSEILLPHLIKNQTGNLIIHLSNNSVLQNKRGGIYNLAVAQIRAMENRSYLIHSEKNGQSTAINPFGQLLSAEPHSTEKVMYATVLLNNKI